MPRKSSNLDKKMIEAGVELIKRHGIASLSVRDVAERAGANLGMFSYHFGTREKFVEAILNEIYLEFIAGLQREQPRSESLEFVLFQIASFSRNNRAVLTSVLSDVLANERVVTRFLRKNFSKHILLIRKALDVHLAHNGLFVEDHHHAVRFLIGAVGVPGILLEVYNRGTRAKEAPESDAELKKRIKAAVTGLEAGFCRKKTKL